MTSQNLTLHKYYSIPLRFFYFFGLMPVLGSDILYMNTQQRSILSIYSFISSRSLSQSHFHSHFAGNIDNYVAVSIKAHSNMDHINCLSSLCPVELNPFTRLKPTSFSSNTKKHLFPWRPCIHAFFLNLLFSSILVCDKFFYVYW